ncbi:hypothetical protein [Daejeonella oryzae]|uniref:hypothetical protein n=1 Tax=Daejeonella oryzae TaxID=1122943 RepID=UPI0004227A4C|nr:hypothetical protein [Daejeonella oryzae]
MDDIIQKTGKLKKATLLFPLLIFSFLIILFINKSVYLSVLQEDGIAEWLTFVCLLISGIISLLIAIRIKKKYHYFHWFFILFFAFNVFAGLEEISYGQRVFGMETTGVFAKYSDQNEINLHNTLQGMFKMKTKHVALYALFIYGVILPWMISKGKFAWIKKSQIIVPPAYLSMGFILGTIMMLDFITGREEEIGEFIYSICFVFFMLHYNNVSKYTSDFTTQNQLSK